MGVFSFSQDSFSFWEGEKASEVNRHSFLETTAKIEDEEKKRTTPLTQEVGGGGAISFI